MSPTPWPSDQLALDANRNAPATLVNASLAMKRLIFIGFGLGNDHFHQFLYDAWEVFADSITRRAIALPLTDDSLEQTARNGKFMLQPMTPHGTGPMTVGRTLKTYPDYTLMLSTDNRESFLDSAFETQMTSPCRSLRSSSPASTQGAAEQTVPRCGCSRIEQRDQYPLLNNFGHLAIMHGGTVAPAFRPCPFPPGRFRPAGASLPAEKYLCARSSGRSPDACDAGQE